jgi:replicative DNA helicase
MQELISTLTERSWAHDLAVLAVGVSEGRNEASELSDWYAKGEELMTLAEEEDEFVTDDLAVLSEAVDKKTGLQWRLPSLREQLGGQKKGSFGFVFARPNTGKTTFLASEVSYFAKQGDRPVIWFNNEQAGPVVKFRLMQAALGWTDEQMNTDFARTTQAFNHLTGGRLKLKDSSFLHKRDIERIVRTHQPSCIVIDCIDKVQGFKNEKKDQQQGEIYNWARMVAKDNCTVIGVSQASASGENKKWLQMDDVAESKTAKQAEADWIIGIGKSLDSGFEHIRYLHIVKDKFGCDKTKIECKILPKIARYEEL